MRPTSCREMLSTSGKAYNMLEFEHEEVMWTVFRTYFLEKNFCLFQLDEEWKYERFEVGLRYEIKEAVSSLEIHWLKHLVDKCVDSKTL